MQKIDNTARGLADQIQQEVQSYLTEVVNISENHDFSQAKLTYRISLFENKIYPGGKFDKQDNYKYWFDMISPAVDAEIKNIDFDTKNIEVYSAGKNDELPNIITNLKIKEYLRETGQAEEINSAIEEGAGWGNIAWKKIKKGYERVDLRNFYVINQTAFDLDQTPVIERHQLSSSDLRAKKEIYANVSDVLKQCGSNSYKTTVETQGKDTTTPYYEVFERNGEVCLKDLKETQGEKPKDGDEDIYVWAKVVAAGVKGSLAGIDIKYVLFAEETGDLNSDIYKEYHRGRYKGRWWREGLFELLFDIQVRGNQIGNQIARGLEYASRTIFYSPDKLVYQNILGDLKNGDIIKTQSLQQVNVRMEGFDQLIGDWNRLVALRNEIANSREIVTGENSPGQPFRLGALLNQNANKLFDFIREKLGVPFSAIFQNWIIPELVRDITGQEVLRLTGDKDMLNRLCMLVVNDWYISNLLALGPHTDQMADMIRGQKLAELQARPQLLMSGLKAVFKNYKPRASVDITGEHLNLDADLQTLGSFAAMEADPVRRTALIEIMLKKKGIDVGGLPKSPPQALQSGPAPTPQASPVEQPTV